MAKLDETCFLRGIAAGKSPSEAAVICGLSPRRLHSLLNKFRYQVAYHQQSVVTEEAAPEQTESSQSVDEPITFKPPFIEQSESTDEEANDNDLQRSKWSELDSGPERSPCS